MTPLRPHLIAALHLTHKGQEEAYERLNALMHGRLP